ncbi:MAG: phytanoyl-CoA dioxygenase family protein, partial [Maricaulaceae bacterium]
ADQVRAPLTQDESFLKIATNPAVLEVVRRCIGKFIVLMQQNGIVNAPAPEPHHQTAWHRDLPYQHITTSRPIAINALFCVDPFEAEMGATFMLPASHLREEFPSEAYVRKHETQVYAKPGSYIVINSMLYHRAGWNRSNRKRRAVNNVYTIPYIKQQIALPAALGGKWSDDPELSQLLGYETDPPRSVAAYIHERARKSGN